MLSVLTNASQSALLKSGKFIFHSPSALEAPQAFVDASTQLWFDQITHEITPAPYGAQL